MNRCHGCSLGPDTSLRLHFEPLTVQMLESGLLSAIDLTEDALAEKVCSRAELLWELLWTS